MHFFLTNQQLDVTQGVNRHVNLEEFLAQVCQCGRIACTFSLLAMFGGTLNISCMLLELYATVWLSKMDNIWTIKWCDNKITASNHLINYFCIKLIAYIVTIIYRFYNTHKNPTQALLINSFWWPVELFDKSTFASCIGSILFQLQFWARWSPSYLRCGGLRKWFGWWEHCDVAWDGRNGRQD